MSSPSEELARLLNQNLEKIFAAQKIPVTVSVQSPQEVEISASVSDLEKAATELARGEASKHGVAIEEVRLNFRQTAPRALEFEANVRAKKMFFATTIRVAGSLEVSEQMLAAISNLTCSGDGAIGSMACGFLGPYLEKFNDQTFPLATFLNDDLSLRDLHFSVGEEMALTVELNG